MYTLDKFHVQESDKVLRLYLVYCLNGKMALINLLIIFRFWYCLACSESARGKGVVTPSLRSQDVQTLEIFIKCISVHAYL